MQTCCDEEFDRSLAAEIIKNNNEILTEVLSRVPAKSLIRFKSVSKHWLSLISDSKFSTNHARKNPNPPISGLLMSYYYYPKCEVIPLQNHPNINFIGDINSAGKHIVLDVCNGLILCSTKCNSLFVCNPTTRKYIKLPKLVESVSSPYCFVKQIANLAFDLSESPHYKVLLTQYYINPELLREFAHYYEVYIYSSGSTSWEKMSIERSHGNKLLEKNKVSWNMAFHWIDEDKTHFRFDLNKKKLTETPKPPVAQDIATIQILYNGNCGGRYFLLQNADESLLKCDVLEMKKGDYSWNVKHTVDFSIVKCAVVESNHYRTFNWLYVLSISEGNGRDDLELVIATRDDVVRCYNVNSNNTEVIQRLPIRYSALFLFTIFEHQLIESMFPV